MKNVGRGGTRGGGVEGEAKESESGGEKEGDGGCGSC